MSFFLLVLSVVVASFSCDFLEHTPCPSSPQPTNSTHPPSPLSPVHAHSWIANLPTHSASAGLTTILSTRIAMSEANTRFDSDKSLSTYEYFSHAVLDAEGKGEGAKLREMIGEASRECREEGVALSTEMVVVIGRKGM